MSSADMSLNSIVESIVSDYVKPKYPIYRLSYTVALIPDCNRELIVTRRNKIVEVKDKTQCNLVFERGEMSAEKLCWFNKFEVVHIDSTYEDREIYGEFDPLELTYIIYKAERLA
jgi:hypothetical protein